MARTRSIQVVTILRNLPRSLYFIGCYLAKINLYTPVYKVSRRASAPYCLRIWPTNNIFALPYSLIIIYLSFVNKCIAICAKYAMQTFKFSVTKAQNVVRSVVHVVRPFVRQFA